MSKILKKWMAQELTAALENVDSFILFGYDKLTAQQSYQLRKLMHEKGIGVKVIKNSIAQIVFSESYGIDLTNILSQTTAIAYGGESPVDVAKELLEWNKKAKRIGIKGGYLSGQVLDKKDVDALSKIPSKPVLLSMLASSLKQPTTKVATVLKASMQKLCYALNDFAEKLEKGSE